MFLKSKILLFTFLLLGQCFVIAGANAAYTVTRDVSYGNDPAQKMDIYQPNNAYMAPVIFMVHGGQWESGDKAQSGVVDNKVAHWVEHGFVLISVNYRLVPEVTAADQVVDVKTALVRAQQLVLNYGGDPNKFIIMGHSAGGHLVSLLTANQAAIPPRASPSWLGVIALDAVLLDAVDVLSSDIADSGLYQVFGRNSRGWAALSPYDQIQANTGPFYMVCTTERDASCSAATDFVNKVNLLGGKGRVLVTSLSHQGVNNDLGLPGQYTAAVDTFMSRLDPSVRSLLQTNPGLRITF